MQCCILWRCGDCRAQYGLAVSIPPELSIEIGEIDGRRRKLRTEPQGGLVFCLGLIGAATPRKEIPQRGARFGSVGVEALGGDELGRGTLEPVTVGGGLA